MELNKTHKFMWGTKRSINEVWREAHSLLVCSCVFPICLIVFIHGVPSGPSDKIGTIESSHPWQEKCLQTTVHRFISDAICKNIWVRIWVQLSRTLYESWKVKILIKIYNGKRGSYFHFINPSIQSKSNHRQRECGTQAKRMWHSYGGRGMLLAQYSVQQYAQHA